MRSLRRHRKIIKVIFFILSPVLIYGLIKLALWYNTKMLLENFSKQAEGIVTINYKTITSSLKGSVSVNGLTVFIPVAEEYLQIKSVRLSANNMVSLLMLNYLSAPKDIPASLSLSIEGLKVDINSKFLSSPKKSKVTPFERFSTLACGNIKHFDAKALTEMGYTAINTDFSISYMYDKLAKTIHLDFYENIDHFFSIELTAQLKNINQIPSSSELAMGISTQTMPDSIPQLGKVKLTINDDFFVRRKIKFCAKNNNSDSKNYISKHVSMAENYLQQLGIKVNQSLISAYQKYLTHPGNIIISMDFSNFTNPMELPSFLLDDIINQLSTKIFINNKPVSPISIQIDQQKMKHSADIEDKEIEIYDPKIKIKIIKQYHPVNKNNLQQYNKRMVIVKTIHGKTFKGQLYIKTSKKIEIITRSHGGEIGYFVNTADIKFIQVFY